MNGNAEIVKRKLMWRLETLSEKYVANSSESEQRDLWKEGTVEDCGEGAN